MSDRRRRANVKGGRPHSWQVTASDEEAAALVVKAEQARKTVPALLFDAAMTQGTAEQFVLDVEVREELTAIRNMMRALGNNINQLAKHANATGEFPAEAAASIKAVQRTAARINDTLLELGQR
ncbi:plasmid mobilization relaxosome protein MobC (plasmid) [Pseudarthrobacter psychrotolerans]|uniref:Plasmid mobilization relaxosome protein MobC n=1 Tax=Pseudarthrobacter psychrotolerans TaxID=2697569 RepID=A0A6P1NZC3_9MICC|nr:plasmid mobilization relaxosome protein MobC [Pseudarthrobacter psychrotolerans]QHK22661.1 plasmid mobilization relaxosome protein MobC [Pseudarthrobacter psychrotolerans]